MDAQGILNAAARHLHGQVCGMGRSLHPSVLRNLIDDTVDQWRAYPNNLFIPIRGRCCRHKLKAVKSKATVTESLSGRLR